MILTLRDFSIEQIALSGQCFCVYKIDSDTWTIYHKKNKLSIKQLSKNKYEFDCDQTDWNTIWFYYFDLGTDYSKIKRLILTSNDVYLKKAVKFGAGLRILRQDLFEAIICFIISQNNNISRITKIVRSLCNPYFPDISDLYKYSITDWQALGVGYRSIYLYEIVQKIYIGQFDLEKLKQMSCSNAIAYLKTLKGIGNKVANCIALFGLHHINAFPRDVWINLIIEKHYNGNFPFDLYDGFLGIVQQYMFYYERNNSVN